MKGWSTIGLLIAAAVIATVPISPQVTPRGLELSVDQAEAQTYGRYRRVTRRAYRRSYRYARWAGYRTAGYYRAGYYRAGYTRYGSGYRMVQVAPNRWCKLYPNGFHWCWTFF